MNASRQVVADVALLVEEHGPLTVTELARALGVPVAEIRRQVTAYSIEPDNWARDGIEVLVYVLSADESGANPGPSPEDTVHVEGDVLRETLGVEWFDAAVLAPLYQAAADLALVEPDNATIASAADKLLNQFLTGVRPRSRFRADTVAILARAVSERQRVLIRYSRAWEPGVYDRVVDPYALVFTANGVELMPGQHADGSIRTYLVPRIESVTALEGVFDRPEDADEIAAAHRAAVHVAGVVPKAREWAGRQWCEEWQITSDDELGMLRFEALLRPPVAWRAGLMMLIAGPGACLDDPESQYHGAELAWRMWAHHGLDEVVTVGMAA